jgi:hypothetical protein
MNPTTWRGLPAWRIAGDGIEAVITAIGGHVACLRAAGDALNPLWQPPWPGRDPASLDAAALDAYGGWPVAPCLASIVGSSICIDRFGPPALGERRPLHGEAGVVHWQAVAVPGGLLAQTRLPEARLLVRRRCVIAGGRLVLTTGVCLDGDDAPRPIAWCEHITLGDPFLDGAAISADLADAWEDTPGGLMEVPVAEALRMPGSDDPPAGSVRCGVPRTGWWEARAQGRCLRVDWDVREFPFLAIWTEHRQRRQAPWAGAGRARGLEITTKPFPEEPVPASRTTSFRGRPATCAVPPGRWLDRTITFSWT